MSQTATMSPNGTAQGFVHRRRYIWIEYPEPPPAEPEPERTPGVDADEAPPPRFAPNPEYRGFAVRVLNNPLGAELRHERELWAQFGRDEIALDDYLQAVAGRVVAWRYAQERDGVDVPVPAPGEVPPAENPDQWQAFYAIPEDLLYWVIGQIRVAHRVREADPKATAASRPPPSTTSMPPGSTAMPIPAPTPPETAPPSP